MNNIDPQWKRLFDTIGVTQTQLEDEETSKFIYDFVESHGGIEKAAQELEKTKGNVPSNGIYLTFYTFEDFFNPFSLLFLFQSKF